MCTQLANIQERKLVRFDFHVSHPYFIALSLSLSSFFRHHGESGYASVYAITRTIWRRRVERCQRRKTRRKRNARRESPPMNHSRRYRPIWTSSPACSEHVYLRFRVSTSRHCTRSSFSLSPPPFALALSRLIVDASISRKRRVSPSRVH